MRLSVLSPTFLWQSSGEPSAAWFLVWMPFVLLVLASDATLSSAMARLLAVLLVSGLIWARGLGPGGAIADRLFVAAWTGSWAAALGTLVTSGRWPASAGGSVTLLAALLVGAGWLGWAYNERQELQAPQRGTALVDASHQEPATPAAIVAAWLLAAALLGLMVSSNSAHWGDGLVLLTSLASFTIFQRGRVEGAEPPD